jgi:hypothetical protein
MRRGRACDDIACYIGRVNAAGATLLLPKRVNTLTNYYILSDSRGKPGAGAEVSDMNAVLCRNARSVASRSLRSYIPGATKRDSGG